MGASGYFDGSQLRPAFFVCVCTILTGIEGKALRAVKAFVERSHILMAVLRSEGDGASIRIVLKIVYKIVPEEAGSIDVTILRLCPLRYKGHHKNK